MSMQYNPSDQTREATPTHSPLQRQPEDFMRALDARKRPNDYGELSKVCGDKNKKRDALRLLIDLRDQVPDMLTSGERKQALFEAIQQLVEFEPTPDQRANFAKACADLGGCRLPPPMADSLVNHLARTVRQLIDPAAAQQHPRGAGWLKLTHRLDELLIGGLHRTMADAQVDMLDLCTPAVFVSSARTHGMCDPMPREKEPFIQ